MQGKILALFARFGKAAGKWTTDNARAIRSRILQNDKLEFEHKKKDKLESLSLMFMKMNSLFC